MGDGTGVGDGDFWRLFHIESENRLGDFLYGRFGNRKMKMSGIERVSDYFTTIQESEYDEEIHDAYSGYPRQDYERCFQKRIDEKVSN